MTESDLLRLKTGSPIDLVNELREQIAFAEKVIRAASEALDEIANGNGCNSKYGPGCDAACKHIAYMPQLDCDEYFARYGEQIAELERKTATIKEG